MIEIEPGLFVSKEISKDHKKVKAFKKRMDEFSDALDRGIEEDEKTNQAKSHTAL